MPDGRRKSNLILIPADGVEFKLVMLGAVDLMAMLRGDGYDPTGWKLTNSLVVPQIRHFKLIRVKCLDFKEVQRELKTRYGSIPEGQWREAFKQAFPFNDSSGPIGFADPSWEDPRGRANFPALYGGRKMWVSDFRRADDDLVVHWRWLIAVASEK